MPTVPIVDIAPLVTGQGPSQSVADKIRAACLEHGFFYVVGHGVPQELMDRLERLSHQFFACPTEQKMSLRMELGGRAWRGYFRVGDELTSGRPDQKEGLYFGSELKAEHPEVKARTPMHGANLFPDFVPGFRETVLEYMDAVEQVGHRLMEGIALSLGLEASYFAERYTSDPLLLFRIFHYPPQDQPNPDTWGVGEHTDYGVLTILRQDQVGGLQVKSPEGWIEAPPIAGSFVCNIGDMLDRMTGGLYRSTPHRVRNESGQSRLSFPLFFDPNFRAEVKPISGLEPAREDRHERWDGASVHAFEGSYGDYVLGKVARVFPQLVQDVL
jgi:polar amino acid transport system ATP-binding protein